METTNFDLPEPEVTGQMNETDSEATRKFEIALNVTFSIIVLAVLYACYTICTAPIEWGFKIDWNCFHSEITFGTCCVIGFFLQFLMKGGWIHTTTEEYIGYKDPNTGKVEKWEKNDDVLTVLFNSILWPLIMHLLLIPMAYGAAIWYTIAGAIALIGKLTPYLISLALIGLSAWIYMVVKRNSDNPKRYVWLTLSACFCFAICGAAYFVTNTDLTSAAVEERATEYITVNSDNVNLRLGPGTDYEMYNATASAGQQLQLLDSEGDWYKVLYEGNEVWIYNKFVDLPTRAEAFVEEIDCGLDEEPVPIVAEGEETATEESFIETPSLTEDIDITTTETINETIAQERLWKNPQVASINSGSHLDKIYLGKQTTSLYVSFVKNFSGPWNINSSAYITSDAAPDKRFYITGVKGTELSPTPCNSHAKGEKVEFVMFFDAVPLNTTKVTLWEGPSADNFHITDIIVPIQTE